MTAFHTDGDILISLSNGYGDALLALPALHVLRRRFPKSGIHLVCQEDQAKTIFSGMEICLIGLVQGRINAALANLSALSPSSFVSWNAYFPSIVDDAIRARFKDAAYWGFADASGVLTPLATSCADAHMRDQYFHVIGLDPQYSLIERQAHISAECRIRFEHWLHTCGLESGERWYALHLDSTEDKMWPLEQWVRLVSHVELKWRATPVIVGEDSTCSKGLLAAFPRACKLPASMGIAVHFAAVRTSPVFIGIDSVFAHIADTFEKPLMVLFGAADPRIWGPVGRQSHVVRCSPRTLIRDLRHEDALNAVDQVIETGFFLSMNHKEMEDWCNR